MSEIRAGEVSLPFDPGDAGDATLAFIGHIRSPWSKGNCPKNVAAAREEGGGARVELRPDYAPALLGLEAGMAIKLLYWVDRGQRDLIVQSPGHGALRGTFALRSPVRPNPIGLACVVIEKIEGATLLIDAIDAWDGTPVLDIKPFLPRVDTPPD